MTELSRNEHIKEASDYLRGTLAEGRAVNEFVDINLATARKVTPGNYQLLIQAYRPSGVTTPLPRSIR